MKNKNSNLEFVLLIISIVLIFAFKNIVGVVVAVVCLILSIKQVKNRNVLTIISLIGSSLLIIFSIISLIVSLVFVTNLFNLVRDSDNSETSAEIVNSMSEHLSSKYSPCVYHVDGFIPSGWDHSYDLLNLSTTIDGVEKDFEVRRYKDKDGYKYCDSYFPLLIENEFRKFIKTYSDKYFNDNLVYTDLGDDCIFGDFNNNSTLTDFLNYKDLNTTIVFVMVKESFNSIEEFNEQSKNLILDLEKNNDKILLRVIYLDEKNYNNLSEENYTDYLADNKITEYNKWSLQKNDDEDKVNNE